MPELLTTVAKDLFRYQNGDLPRLHEQVLHYTPSLGKLGKVKRILNGKQWRLDGGPGRSRWNQDTSCRPSSLSPPCGSVVIASPSPSALPTMSPSGARARVFSKSILGLRGYTTWRFRNETDTEQGSFWESRDFNHAYMGSNDCIITGQRTAVHSSLAFKAPRCDQTATPSPLTKSHSSFSISMTVLRMNTRPKVFARSFEPNAYSMNIGSDVTLPASPNDPAVALKGIMLLLET